MTAAGSRWDHDYVKRQVEIRQKADNGLAKIYVCGPPVMGEQFDRTFEFMIMNNQLDRNIVTVM